MKKVVFNLSSDGLDYAMKEIEDYYNKLAKSEDKILKRLGEYAKERMQFYIARTTGSTSTGELSDSIQTEYSKHLARIFTDLFYASYVEYGTGVIGARSQHPNLPEGWKYDINGYGQAGWVYQDNQGHYWKTKGEISHQFVYRTYRDLKQNYIDIAKQVLKEEGL